MADAAFILQDCLNLNSWKGADKLVLGDCLSSQKEGECRGLDFIGSLMTWGLGQVCGPCISSPSPGPGSGATSSLQQPMGEGLEAMELNTVE